MIYQTDAQRAGMTDAQWNALTEAQKTASRAAHATVTYNGNPSPANSAGGRNTRGLPNFVGSAPETP